MTYSTTLFSPFKLGRVELAHRIVMAPMTRYRADDEHVPLPFVKDYYEQRSLIPGTLVITEGTYISPQAGLNPNIPGIWTPAQISAWKEIVSAVHSHKSHIYLQLWSLGRTAMDGPLKAVPSANGGPLDVVSSSAKKLANVDYPGQPETVVPRELTEDEIQQFIRDYATAAKAAVELAGFDGVEIHGANGYLIDQFTQDTVNERTDRWGGSVENRARFALEITKAVVDAVGADRTAIRFSPFSPFQGMRMKDETLVAQFSYLARQLSELKLAYVHLVEPRINGFLDIEDPSGSLKFFIDAYADASPVILAGGYNGKLAQQAVEEKYKGRPILIAFARPFISNPDLPFKIKHGMELAPPNRMNVYAAKAKEGFIDYPFSEDFAKLKNGYHSVA